MLTAYRQRAATQKAVCQAHRRLTARECFAQKNVHQAVLTAAEAAPAKQESVLRRTCGQKNPSEMSIWTKLSQVNLENKEKFQKVFAETVKKIQNNTFSLNIGEVENDDYYIVVEENRMNSCFVHVVPKQVYALFKEMQQKAPNEMLGFSVLAGKKNGKDVRVSCFGVQCNLLGKALFAKK